MAKALLFNITGEKRMKLQFLLMQFGITAVEGSAEDCGRPLGAILEKESSNTLISPEIPFTDEMLVLDELSSDQFHGLLNGMKMLQATVTYKAVTTKHNLEWTPGRLFRELAAEHAALNS